MGSPLLILLMMVFTAAHLPHAVAAGAWGIITVDSTGDTGYNPSLKLDSLGRPHIAYNDWTEGDLRYGFYDTESWRLETVDWQNFTGGTPSLALDAQGRAHISYFDFDHETLRYARRTDNGWVFETVDASTGAGLYSSIELDAAGRVHIAYQELNNFDLKYAVRAPGGGWQIETVDSASDVGQFASLELDAQGRPCIAYQDWGPFDLKLACKNGSSWNIETVLSQHWVGFYASLAISSGIIHIAHQDATHHNLLYSKKDNGSWTHVVVASTTEDVGQYCSLALDAQGHPHIAYYDSTNRKLKHARFNGVHWTTATLEASGAESWNTSIAVDSHGNPHIAYLNWLSGDLQYARWSNAPRLSWTQEPGFFQDGINPADGNPFTKFDFRVAYWDPDGDPPLSGMPHLHLQISSAAVPGSPFSMTSYKTAGSTTYYRIETWLAAGNYRHRFQAQDRWGVEAVGDPVQWSSGPWVHDDGLSSLQNDVFVYPNPARGDKMTFRFSLSYLEPSIELKIYDLSGNLVRRVANEEIPKQTPPIHEYVWNLRDKNGSELASGLYIYRAEAQDQKTGQEFKAVKKLAILK